ncbi:unnamed protein product [Parnassius apollo]|uniref:(apollo) hypothetical protein n=1 Tax=Parnassius apollo TaxID=110799 RepID=A0A8S3XBL3_PARAO|nr:unnamed protein product [Parnassius apollo]
MRSRLILLFLLNVSLLSCVEVNLHEHGTTITSKTKIELPPFLVKCKLNDIAILPSPAVNEHNVQYYLSKPNGKVIKLDLSDFRSDKLRFNGRANDIVSKFTNDVIKPAKYKLFNVNHEDANSTDDIFEYNRRQMDATEFMMGPFTEGDYGNWVLSVYFTDPSGDTVELFQVISVEIVETVPGQPSFPRLKEGSNFTLSFAYPIKVETCELRPPRSASDRFYDRDKTRLDFCGYTVPNVTLNDEGLWKIIGVGNIVYETKVYLKVRNKNL